MHGEENREKLEEKKNRFELNKLLLYSSSNSFYLFFLFYMKIK